MPHRGAVHGPFYVAKAVDKSVTRESSLESRKLPENSVEIVSGFIAKSIGVEKIGVSYNRSLASSDAAAGDKSI